LHELLGDWPVATPAKSVNLPVPEAQEEDGDGFDRTRAVACRRRQGETDGPDAEKLKGKLKRTRFDFKPLRTNRVLLIFLPM
jgi:hypothetical protein